MIQVAAAQIVVAAMKEIFNLIQVAQVMIRMNLNKINRYVDLIQPKPAQHRSYQHRHRIRAAITVMLRQMRLSLVKINSINLQCGLEQKMAAFM